MIPYILPLLVAIAATRGGKNNSGGRQATSPAMWILLFKSGVIVPLSVLTLGFIWPVRVGGLAVVVAFCLPTLLVAPLLVWLGRPRLAYWTMRCSFSIHYAGNQHAGAMLYATLSATRMRAPAAACEWLEERFRDKPVGGVLGQTILAHLAAAQGDRVTAQCLFESIDARPTRPRRSITRVTARDWLVMDAARRGDWFGVVRYAQRGGGTRWSRAVTGMAQTFAGLPPLPNWQLRLLWLVAPRRRLLRPLLQRALATSDRQHESDIATPPDLPTALTLLAAMVARRPGGVGSDEFLAAVRGVSLRLASAEMNLQVEQRLAALDSMMNRSASSVLSEFKSDVVELILPVVAADPELVAVGRDDPIIAEALSRLQAAAFESIEMRAKDLARRAEKKQGLDTLAEWRSWAVVCDEANRLLALQPEAKAILFEGVWRPLINYAVFQHNEKQRYTFAQDIFRWLRAHAQDGPGAADTLDKNIACYKPRD